MMLMPVAVGHPGVGLISSMGNRHSTPSTDLKTPDELCNLAPLLQLELLWGMSALPPIADIKPPGLECLLLANSGHHESLDATLAVRPSGAAHPIAVWTTAKHCRVRIGWRRKCHWKKPPKPCARRCGKPIRLGLYFPMLRGWQEWLYDPDADTPRPETSPGY
jgi:hypothetical protein